MKNKKTVNLLVQFGILATLFVGCSKSQNGSAPIEVTRIPTVMNKAFDQSTQDARKTESDYVAAMQGNDPATAFLKLQSLSARADLTSEQRSAAARAMATTFQQLRIAADGGNTQAKAVMHQYVSTR
jgi:hypothetical protein